ncbi:class I SAM-dependent methyltransferase [Abyssisolibacter fermentans]|uniref:class I SAM-dependent methyltransferase n=1 Tax=Abyssisolibacter fermentans TaxID=1766203 RepID=UPI0008324455|nr:class I SAM-dependent methyltransferase [Abyssisolibacter fermentans]
MNREELINYIDMQFRYNEKVNLFYKRNLEGTKSNIRPSEYFLFGCGKFKNEIRESLKSEYDNDKYDYLSDYFMQKAIKMFIFNNQYLYFTKSSQKILKDIYIRYIENIYKLLSREEINTKDIEKILYIHSCNLCEFLIETNGDYISKNQSNMFIEKIICEEYSPEFQLKILALNISDIVEPVLDLGCGENANLVKYLRDHGIKAYGLDRCIDKNTDYLYSFDWFDFDYRKNYWGTIISHMAFSNHVYHHMNRSDGHIQKFNTKINELLSSLKTNGSFIYAPGLLGVEAYINTLGQYSIKKHQISSMDQRFYSTRILKF